MLAFEGRKLVGFISYNARKRLDEKYLHKSDVGKGCSYLAEAVVHKEHTGHGIGRQLAELVKSDLARRGIHTIYVKHHEENAPSEKARQRAGFKVVKTIKDPKIRPNGSRRTTVQRFVALRK